MKLSRQLKKISKNLGRPLYISGYMDGNERKENWLELLLEYAESLAPIMAVLNEFSASRKDLEEMYWNLCTAGAGQWVRGHYVAASSICYPETLRYYLSHQGARKVGEDHHSDLEIMYNIVEYFTGKVSLHIQADESIKNDFLWSGVGLLYPIIGVMSYADAYQGSAQWAGILGYGIGQMGYLLIAAGAIKGTFNVFRLQKRSHVFGAAVACLIVGFYFSNLYPINV
jgi:hypothetical protein